MNILQLNMHRGKTADALLPQICTEMNVDMAIISEQYGRITNGFWIEDDTLTAAIWIPTLSKMKYKGHGKGDCFVWVQLETITVISCYLTPNDCIANFERKLGGIEDVIIAIGGDFIVAGDFNSQAIDWGMPTTNSRGRKILDMAARTNLCVANVGNVATYRRPGCMGTIPDITLVSDSTSNRIRNWKVLEIYTGSDHQYISYSLKTEGQQISRQQRTSTRKWNVMKLNKEILIEEMDRRLEGRNLGNSATEIVDRTMKSIKLGCKKSMPEVRSGCRKQAVYWWNNEIADLRRICLSCRRRFTRARRHGEAESEAYAYKEAKKVLRTAIFASKRKKWEELRADINQNPWGLGYKLVLQKLGSRSPPAQMDEETMRNIVRTLFPTHEIEVGYEDSILNDTRFVPFTVAELQKAASSLQNNKAPGPDGVPVEVLKEIALKRPQILLKMYNSCLEEGIFPQVWKRQQLTLISKGKEDNTSPSSYRPLCLLDTSGKLLEKMIKPRLHAAIQSSGGLSERQYGFRQGKCTIGAPKDVISAVDAAERTTHYSRPIVLLATLDV